MRLCEIAVFCNLCNVNSLIIIKFFSENYVCGVFQNAKEFMQCFFFTVTASLRKSDATKIDALSNRSISSHIIMP